MASETSAQWAEKLRLHLPELKVSLDPDDLKNYGRDWTRAYDPAPSLIAFPSSTTEVSKLLRYCQQQRLAVVPSGGRTGLAAGAMATNGELVLSLDRLRSLGTPDPLALNLRVQAGVRTQEVHEACQPFGLTWPVDLASKGSSQVGGNLATNAGGLRVIRYGHARNWVQSLQVVLMDGTVLELHGDLEKNNAGYDLRQLFVGSEGTLGIITEATLRLSPLPRARELLFCGLASMEAVMELLASSRASGLQIEAFECWTEACLRRVIEVQGLAEPFGRRCPFYALVEMESPRGAEEQQNLQEFLQKIMSQNLVQEGTLAEGAANRQTLWSYRESISESLQSLGLLYKNDLALPLRRLASFAQTLLAQAPQWYPGCELYFFGHVGDGNLHVNVLNASGRDRASFMALCENANHALFALVQSLGGSIAAEHGIGLLKRDFLAYSRSPHEISLMRQLKAVFDPHGLLNPGKIFAPPS